MESFLSSLAAAGSSASTQNQALSAILFLYGAELGQRLGWMNSIVRARRPVRLPVVLSRDEVTSIYTHVLNRGGRGVRSPLDQMGPGLGGR